MTKTYARSPAFIKDFAPAKTEVNVRAQLEKLWAELPNSDDDVDFEQIEVSGSMECVLAE